MIKTLKIFIVICLGIGVARAALPEPFSITWNLVQDSFYATGQPGFAFDNEIGYVFANQGAPKNSLYNFANGSVTPFPNFVASYYKSPCVVPVPNGDIYIIGATPVWDYDFVPNPLYDVYKLAAGSNSYTKMARLHTGRIQPSCTYDAATNRIYVFAGFYCYTASFSDYYYPEQSTEYYSIDNDTWTVTADLPSTAVYSATVNTNDGFIYLFGGFMGISKTIYRYNIGNDTWTDLGTTNKDNYGQIGAYYEEENIILLFGGQNAENDGCEYFNLTSMTMVPYTCLTNDNTTITGGNPFAPFFGTFIPSTRTMYAMNPFTAKLWTASIPTPPAPVPIPAPVSEPLPVEPVPVPVPSAPEPVTQPTSRPPPSKIISEAAVHSRSEIVLTSASGIILAALVL